MLLGMEFTKPFVDNLMKDYTVTIEIKKLYGSFVEADSQDEAIDKAIKEWEYNFGEIDREDLIIDCEEVIYDEDY